MRTDVNEIEHFPDDESLEISVELIHKFSPDSLSIMEFKGKIDLQTIEKMYKFPLLREKIPNKWKLELHREFNVTDDSDLFYGEKKQSRLPLYEGKMIHQFTHEHSEPRYWVEETECRKALLKRGEIDQGQRFNYQEYRLCYRDVARNTDARTLIATIVAPNVFTVNTLVMGNPFKKLSELLFVVAIMNSFSCDFVIRQKVTAHCNMFYVYQLPVPRLVEGDPYFSEIVDRAAKLICTTPEFDDLAAEVGLGSHANGVTDETERAQLRAELDGMIAHLYGLTEAEFQHILSTFPIVPAKTKQVALEAYRTFTPIVGDAEILTLIAQAESAQLEFKSTARWNLKENKKDPTMEEVILKTVAGFLNSDGGTLLIGVEDDGNILGLQPDYQTLKKKNRDGYELWLMNDLLLKELGKDLAPFFSVSFHIVDSKEVCRITVRQAPEPVYVNIRNPKSGQLEECLFIRTGNLTSKLDTPRAIAKYIKTRWG